MNQLEEDIWNYIDGLGSDEELKKIGELIKIDALYKAKYEELILLNLDLQRLDIDEPSMVFTNKVMDAIEMQTKPLSAKAAIDKRIIFALASFFGLMLMGCLIMAIGQINWAEPLNLAKGISLDFDNLNDKLAMNSSTKSYFIYAFLMFDTIAGLMLFDRILRKRIA